MRVRGVDASNDWLFGKGKNDYKLDIMALSQNIKCRLQCFLGDCFFNLSGGIDWFNLLGTNKRQEILIEVSSIILNTSGVVQITNLQFIENEKREFSLTYSVDTIYGSLNNEVLEVISA